MPLIATTLMMIIFRLFRRCHTLPADADMLLRAVAALCRFMLLLTC